MLYKFKELKIPILVAGGTLCAILLLWTVHTLTKQPRIAIINITGIVNQFAKAEGETKRPSEQVKQRAHAFGTKLEKTVRDIARQENLVVFPSEALLHGGIDITEKVKNRLKTVKEE